MAFGRGGCAWGVCGRGSCSPVRRSWRRRAVVGGAGAAGLDSELGE